MEIVIQLLILALGFVLLVKGSDFFVDGAAGVASRLGIPEIVIGLTIVAMGTSAPEAAVSITGALKGSADISVGNVLGSNILNILVILGIASAIVNIKVQNSTVRYEMPFLVLISLVFAALGYDGFINRSDGMVLIVLFVIYMLYMFVLIKNNDEGEEEERQEKRSLPVYLVFIIGGLAAIMFGSNLAVDSASALARIIGISERIIGLTIVALGTSLPELFTSVNAARKGNADLAIGNIVGSCIFNLLFVIGISSLIIPIPFAATFITDAAVASAAAAVLLVLSFIGKKLERIDGIMMLVMYAVYFAFIL